MIAQFVFAQFSALFYPNYLVMCAESFPVSRICLVCAAFCNRTLLKCLQISQLEDGLRQLYVLEAIDADGRITDIGREVSRLPVDPSIARALLAAKALG